MPLDPHRARLVQFAIRDSQHPDDIDYSETRPTNVVRYRDARWPVSTDCSGWYQCLCYASGLPDPMGTDYAGAATGGCEGFTGTMLSYLQPIKLAEVLPGDSCVFGAYPGVHAVVFLAAGTGGNPEVGSNGRPEAPERMPLSQMAAGFPGRPATYLRLPAPGLVPRKWKVRSATGRLLAETEHPVRWAAAHPRTFRRHVQVSFHQEEQQ